MKYDLKERAAKIYPKHEHNQTQWLRAINHLRTATTNGWVLDKEITKKCSGHQDRG